MPQVRVLVLLFVWSGCTQTFKPTRDAGADMGIPGIGVGGGCAKDTECRAGLVCKPDTKSCQPASNKVPGASCILSDECLPGNFCAMGTCKASGKQPEGGPCAMEGDCAAGLVCNLSGLAGTCAKAGAGDLGAPCQATTGCRGGLVCSAGTCQTMPMTMMPTPAAASCTDDEEATPRVLFRVPRAGETSDDFYRLPFPNDIRMKNGRVTLTGHPRPGPGLIPVDVVDRYIKAIEAESTGFSANPAVYFRFSRRPKFETLRMADAVTFYNITPGSPHYGQKGVPGWYTSTGREKYLCPRWLVARHAFGAPLRPGETYAYVIKRVVTDEAGAPMQQDDDFKAMLAASAPADAELAAAWQAYAPLRAWIADKQIDAASLAGVAVFTTEKLDDQMLKLRQVARAAPAPMIKNLVRCGDAARSPCDDGKTGPEHTRGCVGVSNVFEEYQGTISLPVFQKGTPPYDQPADGGGIELDAGGLPRVQRTEDVCFALTVPRSPAPAAGWPVVVYSHGTGGGYRNAVEQNLALDYAAGEVPGGSPVPMATFAYDGVLHGNRKGTSTRPVTELVYNFLNPQAARDNAVQAAADLFSVARALESFSAGGIKVDAGKLAVYGHSQGGNAAANAAGYEPLYGAVVLSGTGGSLILSLLHKQKPVNVSLIIPLVLGEAVVNERHPVLNLLQMYLDRADSVNFGRRLFADPPPGSPPRHVLQIYGTDDTYSPVETMRTFGTAAGFDLVGPVLDPVYMMEISEMHRRPAIASPARLNFAAPGGKMVTAVEAQYKPTGAYDGHFVSTSHPRARAAIQQFLTSFVRDGMPVVAP